MCKVNYVAFAFMKTFIHISFVIHMQAHKWNDGKSTEDEKNLVNYHNLKERRWTISRTNVQQRVSLFLSQKITIKSNIRKTFEINAQIQFYILPFLFSFELHSTFICTFYSKYINMCKIKTLWYFLILHSYWHSARRFANYLNHHHLLLPSMY